MRSRFGVVVLVAVAIVAALGAASTEAHAVSAPAAHRATPTIPPTDWPAYLNGTKHHSYNASEKAISPGDVAQLVRRWEFTAGDGYLSSPTVFGGAVYIGANNGWLYKLSMASGKVLAKRFLGTVNITSCPAPPTGMVSTATVALSSKTGNATVYVSGANGYLYALSASNLTVEWKSVIAIPSHSVNNYFDWSSPSVAYGRIYIGVSSNCDSPLIRGGIVSFDQQTGTRLAVFRTVPADNVGGSVWSSVAVASDGDVYASTGNGPFGSGQEQLLGYSESIIKLSPGLRFLGRFQVPPSEEGFDTDFGASPVLFDNYVGACNKNGIFYALHQSTMKLAWERQISGPAGDVSECIASPVWNGKHLFFGTPETNLAGVSYSGSVQERDPDGKLVWFTGLPNGVDGSPTMDGAGVLAVGTYDDTSIPNAIYLLSSDGRILRKLVAGLDFAESVFADSALVTANQYGVSVWTVGGRAPAGRELGVTRTSQTPRAISSPPSAPRFGHPGAFLRPGSPPRAERSEVLQNS